MTSFPTPFTRHIRLPAVYQNTTQSRYHFPTSNCSLYIYDVVPDFVYFSIISAAVTLAKQLVAVTFSYQSLRTLAGTFFSNSTWHSKQYEKKTGINMSETVQYDRACSGIWRSRNLPRDKLLGHGTRHKYVH